MAESWKDLDRLMSAGRQLVDGVSGARPGSRSGNRGEGRRLAGLGRWVENKLDWILEDEDDWREPWQETRPELGSQDRPRRRLDAISRRSAAPP
ncbi:MAG: RNA helicase, partial [Cyanobium sp. MAG_04]|nr:RNA helicase [Cyanobium sp. MAG_04]